MYIKIDSVSLAHTYTFENNATLRTINGVFWKLNLKCVMKRQDMFYTIS